MTGNAQDKFHAMEGLPSTWSCTTPLHNAAMRERGGNQAVCLRRHATRNLELHCCQVSLNLECRLARRHPNVLTHFGTPTNSGTQLVTIPFVSS